MDENKALVVGGEQVASPPDPGDTSQGTGRRGCGLGVIAVVALLCGGLFAAYALPRFVTMGRTAKLAEVRQNVNAIKTAQAAYKASHGSFLPAGPHPRSLESLSPRPADWTSGSAFDALGWSPDGRVRGTYQVEVLPDSIDFIVHGWIDADGDGVPAHYTATKESVAKRVTPKSVE